MAKKLSASSRQGKRAVKSAADILAYTKTAAYKRETARLKAKKDSDIDFSDIPELTDEQLARMVRARVARLRAQPINIRIEPDILEWLKGGGPGYQTRINSILREHMKQERQAR